MSPAPRIKPTCPNCWFRFEPYDTLWVAAHPSLRGDVRLGTDAYRRFLPSRFSAQGDALDERGEECSQIACPRCHLPLPWASLELEPWFVSVFGTPASGKSYYLATMTRNLRRKLLEQFRVNYTDTDAETNQIIAGFERSLFSSRAPGEAVPLGQLIDATGKAKGDLGFNVVTVGTDEILYPQPFLFTLRPADGHPLGSGPDPVSRIMCLYDNAGESFHVGRDTVANPVTRHLAESALLLFLFDPTQHPPFQQRLVGRRLAANSDFGTDFPSQHLVLTEAAVRVRRFARLRDADRHARPLVVVVTKKDVWGTLVPELTTSEPMYAPTATRTAALNLDLLHRQSDAIRRLLVDLTPEVVMAAESFASSVVYVGVSSLGTAPTPHPVTKEWSIRPADIRPDAVELPILYGLHLEFPKLIPGGRRRPPSSGGR